MANVKTGYWKKNKDHFDGYVCSECNTKFPMSAFKMDEFNEFGSTIEIYKKCPNCETVMTEVRE